MVCASRPDLATPVRKRSPGSDVSHPCGWHVPLPSGMSVGPGTKNRSVPISRPLANAVLAGRSMRAPSRKRVPMIGRLVPPVLRVGSPSGAQCGGAPRSSAETHHRIRLDSRVRVGLDRGGMPISGPGIPTRRPRLRTSSKMRSPPSAVTLKIGTCGWPRSRRPPTRMTSTS